VSKNVDKFLILCRFRFKSSSEGFELEVPHFIEIVIEIIPSNSAFKKIELKLELKALSLHQYVHVL